jgi:thioredoxin
VKNYLREERRRLDCGMNFLRKYFPVLVVAVVLTGCGNPAAMNESTANVKHITQGEFADEVTRCATPVVADFYATWCGPCRELSPLLDRVAGGYTDKIKFVKINVDESPGLAQNFQVQAIPTLIFFKDGKVADRVTGLLPEADLKAKLDALTAGK